MVWMVLHMLNWRKDLFTFTFSYSRSEIGWFFFSASMVFILLVFELQTGSGFITHIPSRNPIPHPPFHAIFPLLLFSC